MSNVAKSTIILMLATIIAKIMGFIRELVLAAAYGASIYSDAYLTAMNIPWVIFIVVGTAISTSVIPIYYDVNKARGEKESLKFINNILNIVIIICIIMAIFGAVFTEQIVKIFAMGFKGEVLFISIKFTRIMVFSIIITGMTYIMTSYLQIKGNFTIPGIISIPKNIIIIVSIILSIKLNPYIMIWGTMLGTLLEFLTTIPFVIKNGYKFQLYINLHDEYIKKSVKLILPVLIGVGVNQINTLVDRTLASTLNEGSISALNYANRLNGFIMALFITSIGSVIYPTLSKLSNDKDLYKMKEFIIKSVNIIILLIIPISLGAIVLSKPIVSILFERGKFNVAAVEMTSMALVFYSIGMTSFGLTEILGKVFYSLKDSKTPMINAAMSMSINIILNIILVKILGLAGLPLATSLSSIICVLLLFRKLEVKIGYFGKNEIIKTFFKSIFAASIMSIIVYGSFNILDQILTNSLINNLISVSLSVVIGGLIYGGITLILSVNEVKYIINIIRDKIKLA